MMARTDCRDTRPAHATANGGRRTPATSMRRARARRAYDGVVAAYIRDLTAGSARGSV